MSLKPFENFLTPIPRKWHVCDDDVYTWIGESYGL